VSSGPLSTLGRLLAGKGDRALSGWAFCALSTAPLVDSPLFVRGFDNPAGLSEPDRARRSFRAAWSRPKSLAAAKSCLNADSSVPVGGGVEGGGGTECAAGAETGVSGCATECHGELVSRRSSSALWVIVALRLRVAAVPRGVKGEFWYDPRKPGSCDKSIVRCLRNRDMNPRNPGPADAGGLGTGNLNVLASAALDIVGAPGIVRLARS
jgi:hypothetical protein